MGMIDAGGRAGGGAAAALTYSQQIAAWYAAVRYEDLPDDVVRDTRMRVLDIVGLMLAGSALEYGSIARNAAQALGGRAESHVLGFGDHLGATAAAVANGLMAHCLEFDDTHNETLVHASVTSVTAALAAGEMTGACGKDVITAVAGANEIACRIALVVPGMLHKNGFHSTALAGAFSATYLACRLLGLHAEQMRHAVGIAGSMTAGSLECWTDSTHAKALHPGWAAHSGITAAYLARAGLTGPGHIFEGRWGFFRSYVQQPNYPYRFDRMVGELGAVWDSRNLSFKPYPVGHVSHPFIDALLHLYRAEGLRAADVERIICRIHPDWIPIVMEPVAEKLAPQTAWHGRVSLQYTLAEALHTGRIDVRSYGMENLKNPEILALARKVGYEPDVNPPNRSQFKGWVIVETKNGRRLERVEEFNRGSRENPMSREEIVDKFRANAEFRMSKQECDRIITACEQLESLPRIADLVQLCIK